MDILENRLKILNRRKAKIELEIAAIRHEQYQARESARCDYNKNSNMRCLLDKHDGLHHLPCVDQGAHGAHSQIELNYYISCSGHVFDRT